MLSSFWQRFLQFIEKDKKTIPVLFSILKQTSPLELNTKTLTLACENQIVESYLKKNLKKIEILLKEFNKQKLTLSFVLISKKVQKKEPPPLLNFQPSEEDLFFKAGLNIQYDFEKFAVSTTNQVAYAASQAVVDNPGRAYNPLFFYGGVGVGKTHLAQATAKKILEKDPGKKVYFCPGDQFTNELIESIRSKTTVVFRKKYRRLNLLIIDDVQFIAGKVAVQEEFFHTFNSIVPSGGQIILTSDRPPREIKNLEDRLRSRFSGGLIIDIQAPDFELRTAILLIKAKEKNINIDIEVAKIIAEQIKDSRSLEGVLLSIYAKTLNNKQKIDLEAIESYFQNKTEGENKKFNPNDIIRTVCSYYNLKPSQIKSTIRRENIAQARQLIMFLLRTRLRLTFDEIAYLLKRKDHTTIIHGVGKISRLLAKDDNYKKEIDGIINSLVLST